MVGKYFLTIAFICFSVLGAGCVVDTELKEEDISKKLIPDSEKNRWERKPKSTHLRVISKKDRALKRNISVSSAEIPLIELLSSEVPGVSVIADDKKVDLKQNLSIFSDNISVENFLRQVEGITGYGIDYRNGNIHVSSYTTKLWNVSAIASNRQSRSKVGQSQSGSTNDESQGDATDVTENSLVVSSEENSFERIISGVRSILQPAEASQDSPNAGATTGDSSGALPGATGQGAAGGGESADMFQMQTEYLERKYQPYVTGVRNLGLIAAGGEPYRMRAATEFVENIKNNSEKQVNIAIQAYDVTLEDNRNRGINWDVLVDGTWNGNSVGLSSSSDALQSAGSVGGGVWTLGANMATGTLDGEVLLDFLGKYGTVELLNQPNVTTLNGSTAHISAGDEFSFVSDVEQGQDEAGNITVTPSFERMKIGVSLAVTPRVLDDDRILIEVTPIVSSLTGFDSFDVQGFKFDTPIINLQELSTQVITESGKPIQLGGLITKKVTEAMNRIPQKDDDGGFMNFLFKSVGNELNRRELVITLTPKIVESGEWTYSQN